MTDERESKLPQWAQRELETLRCEVISLRKACKDLGDNPGLAMVSWTDYIISGALPDRAQVTFRLGDSKIEMRIDSNRTDGLRISSGTNIMRLEPAAANVIYVSVRP